MKALVIFPSARSSSNFAKYAENFARFKHQPDIMVIDEFPDYRTGVLDQFSRHGAFNVSFFGIRERKNWFHDNLQEDVDLLIPRQSHDELSFGLLVAATEKYDMVCFVDDDTYPSGQDFLGEHYKRLCGFDSQVKVNTAGGWVNTHPYMHARGYPYCQRPGDEEFSGWTEHVASVLNMGLWEGIPDLNAIDYLSYDFSVKADPTYFSKVEDFHLSIGQYAPICSMNVAFKPEIIPAFYQLWDNNRYNDIFSGIFLKRIADHLKKPISIGNPLCYHEKAPRDLFTDAERELASVKLNESLWKTLDKIALTSDSWLGCYRQLANGLHGSLRESEFGDTVYRMTRKMLLWCDVIEQLQEAL